MCVLIKAKEEKLITEVSVMLNELKNNAGFWLNADLEKKILLKLGEN